MGKRSEAPTGRGVRRSGRWAWVAVAVAGAWAGGMGLMGWGVQAGPGPLTPTQPAHLAEWGGSGEPTAASPVAGPEALAASLAQGAAWIWPISHGPQATAGQPAPYREAAVLVETLLLHARSVSHAGRRAPLALPAGVRLLPVLHIEATDAAPDALLPAQRLAIVAAALRHAPTAASGAGWLQLDFEAPARQRASYRALVAQVRAALPASVRLSVTALAHWCAQGDWLDQLEADEVVPMLYRLGPHAALWRQRFLHPGPGWARRCQGPALGFARQEPPPAALLARTARAYWFDEAGWGHIARPPLHLLEP